MNGKRDHWVAPYGDSHDNGAQEWIATDLMQGTGLAAWPFQVTLYALLDLQFRHDRVERAVLWRDVNLRWLGLALLTAFSACAQPAQVILFRHAEKPLNDAIPHLSLRGYERAAVLALYLSSSPIYTNFGAPVAIFAADPTTDSPSQRTVETLTPYAERIGLTIQTPYSADNYRSLATAILGNADYAGKTVVICWPHDQIPALAHALNLPNPPKWKGSQFDRVWVIRYNTGKPRLFNLPQRLLFRDSPY